MLPYLLSYLDDESDKRLLEDIFNAYAKQMFLLARSYLCHDADAEDAVATVFERIATKNFDVVRSIESEQDLRNYLLKATKNTALNMIEKKRNGSLFLEKLLSFGKAKGEAVPDGDFLKQVYDKMECEDLIQAILGMEEKYRDALYYHFVVGKTIRETAKLTFQSVSATKQQLVRGKKLLLALLKKGGEKNGDDGE